MMPCGKEYCACASWDTCKNKKQELTPLLWQFIPDDFSLWLKNGDTYTQVNAKDIKEYLSVKGEKE
jgi:hypothetical protein